MISEEASKMSNHFKELNAKTKAINPHFITLLVAREGNASAPKIKAKGNYKKMKLSLKFENGDTDKIVIDKNGIQFNRNKSLK